MTLTIGSLFSGIGGLELGLEWAGLGPVLWQVEKDPFCRAVLAKHWPGVERHEDVCAVGIHNLERVDIICGGFPCQDISYAGKGAGLAGERSGLWFEYARIVREMEPRFIVVENVSALLSRGMEAVLGSLASLGYDAWWDCIPAAAVGAPHIRDRVFLVAHASGGHDSRGKIYTRDFLPSLPGRTSGPRDASISRPAHVADGESPGGPWSGTSILDRGSNGLPDRVDRLRALGNAVVPQCAEVVGWVIREIGGF